LEDNLRALVPWLATVCLPLAAFHPLTPLHIRSSHSARPISAHRFPITFEANAGQTDPRVQFLSHHNGQTLFLTSSEAVFQSGRDIVRMRMIGSNPAARADGLGLQAVRSNYFQGPDPSSWRTNIPNYERVQFHEIYPGIDLVYRGGSSPVEYDWIVNPGADPSKILLKFEGAENIVIDTAGDLVLHTLSGVITHKKPSILQAMKSIAGRYAILPDSTVRLEIAAYDRSKPLIIDPVLTYSSFLGGSALDQGNAIAVDSTGAAYLGGTTGSSNFPTLPARTGPPGQGFITKVSPDGKSLIYSTYISGTSFITGLAVNSTGEVFVTGTTSSPTDFPTVNAFQPHQNKAPLFQDSAFVTKLSANGNALLYSTYLGGSQNDEGKAIAVDAAGSAYVAGDTGSPDFPTVKPIQSKQASSLDAFVTKLSPDGTTLVYSTYLGGDSGDKSFGIAVDPGGNAYVTGQTASSNYPTLNAFQPTSLFAAAFITKINPSGTAFVYSTYLGGNGSGSTVGYAIAADSSGNAYIGGADSTNFLPLRSLCFLCGGGTDGFVTKLTPSGSPLYSAYLAGTSLDKVMGIAVNSRGEPWVSGLTSSPNFPTTPDAIMKPQTQFATQVFVSHLNSSGNTIIFSTCLAGTNSGDDEGHAIALDANGDAYVTGMADSTDFPTVTPFQKNKGTTNAGPFDGDAFVLKITNGPPLPVVGNVVNGASFQSGIAANAWGTIQGANLSTVSDTWDKSIVNGKLPTSLDNVTVMIGGQLAYLYYVSPEQINFVAPNVSPGSQPVIVTNSLGISTTFTATVTAFAPSFFTWPNNQPVATRQDFSWAVKNGTFSGTATVAAKPGDTLILWGTGFGPTTPATTAGVLTPGDRTYSTSALPAITINGVSATTYGAALAPGFAALYQVAIQVPSSLADGDWPVIARIGGAASPNGILLSVHK
jgi:uncharacterized protein (TIGR03437 family)